MKIRKIYDRERIRSCSGTPEKIVYGSKVLSNGRIATFEKGKEDYYAYINSFADSVDINKTIQRFVNGDINALNQRKGEFIDCTQFPTNYAEVLNVINNATNIFNSLSVEDRAKFNFNLNEFITAIGTEKYNQVLGVKPEEAEKLVDSSTVVTNPTTQIVSHETTVVNSSTPEVTTNPTSEAFKGALV